MRDLPLLFPTPYCTGATTARAIGKDSLVVWKNRMRTYQQHERTKDAPAYILVGCSERAITSPKARVAADSPVATVVQQAMFEPVGIAVQQVRVINYTH